MPSPPCSRVSASPSLSMPAWLTQSAKLAARSWERTEVKVSLARVPLVLNWPIIHS